MLSREYYYLGTQLPMDRFLTFYYGHPGFHINNILVILAVQLFMFAMVFIGKRNAVWSSELSLIESFQVHLMPNCPFVNTMPTVSISEIKVVVTIWCRYTIGLSVVSFPSLCKLRLDHCAFAY